MRRMMPSRSSLRNPRLADAVTIEGVRVPFLSLEMLIKSKTACREQDRADLVRLPNLLELKRQRGDAAK
jgi:hypothetical protein